MAQNKTRAHLPKPIPAMLEGSFGTTIENRIAELNNQLAREGRLTNDPLAVSLRNVRIALKEQGFTFERVLTGAAPTTPAPVQTAAPVKRTTTTKTTAPAVTTGPRAREIDEKQIDTLQVAGTVSEEAPYGRDASGRALAPYGVKKDGIPMKRRGRVAAAPVVAAAPKPTTAAATAAVDEEDAELESEVDAAQAALEASTEDDLDEEAPEEGGASEEDLDDLLAGFE